MNHSAHRPCALSLDLKFCVTNQEFHLQGEDKDLALSHVA